MQKCQNETCQNSFTPKQNNQKYCCQRCLNSHRQRIWRNHHKKPCIDCGKPILHHSKRCTPCSRKHAQFVNINMTLKEYMNLSTYKGHPSWRHNKIRALAQYAFKDLTLLPCANCGYNKHVEICHIIPIASFPEDTKIKDINSPSNIIQLCPNCHWESHNGIIDASSIKR